MIAAFATAFGWVFGVLAALIAACVLACACFLGFAYVVGVFQKIANPKRVSGWKPRVVDDAK